MQHNWYGFNLLPMFIKGVSEASKEDIKAMDFMAEEGFNYVRLPMDYRFWTTDFDYKSINEGFFSVVDEYIERCLERKLHISLNLHRAPGYCINRNDLERDNLWTDDIARQGFEHNWRFIAERYAHIPESELSFDLLNEPPGVGFYEFTRKSHQELMRSVIKSIRAVSPQRVICLNGIGGGHEAIPELADTNTIHSGRGYMPMSVSHYQAEWWEDGSKLQEPIWPDSDWAGKIWNKEALDEFYKPWREVQASGTRVFIGEMGCYNKTPDPVAKAWLTDLLSLYQSYNWGFAFWNFSGPFGIADHQRPGAKMESYRGLKIDRELLGIIKEHIEN